TLAFVAAHGEVGADLERLRALWTQVGKRPAATPPARSGPLLLVALAEAAHDQGEKLYLAALPYGKAAGPGAGLYYLGQAEGQRRFGDFAAQLAGELPQREPPPARSALGAALAALESESLVAFDRNPGGGDLIATSASLKEARELFEAGADEGATLALL